MCYLTFTWHLFIVILREGGWDIIKPHSGLNRLSNIEAKQAFGKQQSLTAVACSLIAVAANDTRLSLVLCFINKTDRAFTLSVI